MESIIGVVVVSLGSFTMTLPDNTVIPIAVGESTPVGEFGVVRKVRNPVSSKFDYGQCAILLEDGVTGIHGSPDQRVFAPGSDREVTNGCIRVPRAYEQVICDHITFWNTIVITE